MNKLIGKTDLVSGVSRDIGRTGALALTQAGAPVLVHDSSDEKEGARIKAKTRQLKSGHLGPASSNFRSLCEARFRASRR